MAAKSTKNLFAVCIANEGCDDLEIWKLYRVLPDAKAAEEDFLRDVDESGEDYLYPASRFVVVDFSPKVAKRILAAPAGV
jgi:hypothetical protein